MIVLTAIPEGAVRRELTKVLAEHGWTVLHGLNADDVLARCREHGADVVLVDRLFPGGAVALLDRLKSDLELFQTAVILVGEDFDVGEVVAAMDSGATDVLRRPFVPAEVVARLMAAGRTRALVLELTEQQDHLSDLVLSDELTGVRNRRAILADLEQMLAAARRHPHALSLVMLDLDRFKAINDVFGHGVGDEVLREVTRRIQTRLRVADALGRLGGDELLVLLPDTDLDGATVLADAIREEVAAEPFATDAGPVGVTVSLGTAQWAGEPAADLIERADQALLSAKSAGRDRSAAAR